MGRSNNSFKPNLRKINSYKIVKHKFLSRQSPRICKFVVDLGKVDFLTQNKGFHRIFKCKKSNKDKN